MAFGPGKHCPLPAGVTPMPGCGRVPPCMPVCDLIPAWPKHGRRARAARRDRPAAKGSFRRIAAQDALAKAGCFQRSRSPQGAAPRQPVPPKSPNARNFTLPKRLRRRSEAWDPRKIPPQAHPAPRFFKRARPGSCPCSLPKASWPGGRTSKARPRTSGLARIPDLRPAPGRLRRRGGAQEAAASPEELDPSRDGQVKAGYDFRRFHGPAASPLRAAVDEPSCDRDAFTGSRPRGSVEPEAGETPGLAGQGRPVIGSAPARLKVLRERAAHRPSVFRKDPAARFGRPRGERRSGILTEARKAGRRPGEFRLEQPPGSLDGCLSGARP